MKTLSPTQLQTELLSESPPIVLDVRLAEDFSAAQIAAALNNSVFEVAFHQRLASQVTDKSQRIILVGASRSSQEARMAFEKLERAEFADVLILEGGFEEWVEAGLPIQSLAPPPCQPTAPNGRLAVDLSESRVEWIGRNLLNKHWGTVAIKSGAIDCDAGKLTGGEFILDLTRLTCIDLAGTPVHDVLVNHLQDHDFFDVARFPEARLVITQAEVIGSEGAANIRITADLSLRGETHPIVFEAEAGVTADGKAAAQASFQIDRTQWGVIYGSGRFFKRLAGHLVNDLIEFQIKIVTV
ncbi:MAG: YceI family protein [Akkermansiaceae bacterium]|nr:YceI family protein [Akkermansiaceae bacterium]